jgi:hypothetical protein
MCNRMLQYGVVTYILGFNKYRGLWMMLDYFVCSFFTSIPLTLIMTHTGFLKDFLISAMLGGSLLPQHGASSACRWRNGLQLWRVAANILNKQQRTNGKGWSSSLGVGHGANNPSL